jgi:hypothetical protein
MFRLMVCAALLALVAAGAGTADGNAPRRALVTWKVQGETFRTYLRRDADVRKVRKAIRQHSTAGIPNGRVVRGTRENKGHAWHLVNVQLADVTTEVCDGKPSDVDGNLAYWAGTVKRFCPWSARPTALRFV